MTGDAYVCVDQDLRERTSRYLTSGEALAAGTALLPTLEDDALALMLVRSGAPAGATPAPTPDEIGDNTRSRLIKLGQLRFFNDVVTYSALGVPDNLKRTDTDL